VKFCNFAYLALKWKEKQVISEKSALSKERKIVLVPNKENSFDLASVSIAVYVQILTVFIWLLKLKKKQVISEKSALNK
jgi:hypothetical protein